METGILKQNIKNTCACFTLNRTDKEKIIEEAKKYGITISDYIRVKIFSERKIEINGIERMQYEEKIKLQSEIIEELKEKLLIAKG